jgi:hypothetical protein
VPQFYWSSIFETEHDGTDGTDGTAFTRADWQAHFYVYITEHTRNVDGTRHSFPEISVIAFTATVLPLEAAALGRLIPIALHKKLCCQS